jgi:predicted ATPase
MSIHSISLKNFKSIREATDIKLGPINVLIGANGSGKSNFISFFKLLKSIVEQNLQYYIAYQSGKADSFLYFGAKQSPFLEGGIEFRKIVNTDVNNYAFRLFPTPDSRLIFGATTGFENQVQRGLQNSWGEESLVELNIPESSHLYFQSFRVFHFHDTSDNASVKRFCNVNDNRYLREDAGNLAAFLYRLKQSFPKHFNLIEKTIQSVAPFFDRFDLLPDQADNINLKWLEKGSDAYRDAHYLSDGTLRFICLTTLLLQPDPPATIIIDEPELGLHPSAIDKLAAMIQSASVKTQIIVSTQSIELLNNFSADDVIVVEKKDNQSVFKRLDAESLKDWLEDYTLGELWYKNVIGGKPQ